MPKKESRDKTLRVTLVRSPIGYPKDQLVRIPACAQGDRTGIVARSGRDGKRVGRVNGSLDNQCIAGRGRLTVDGQSGSAAAGDRKRVVA